MGNQEDVKNTSLLTATGVQWVAPRRRVWGAPCISSYERGTPERLLRERNKYLLRLAGQGIQWRRVWSHLRNRRGEAGCLASDGCIEGKLAVLGVTAPPEFMEAGRLQWFQGPDVHREGQSPWCLLGACLMGPTEREGSQASAERSWR